VTWPFWKRFVIVALVLLVAMLPPVGASLLWTPEIRGIAVLGFIPGIVGTLKVRWQHGVLLSVVLGAAGAVAILVHDTPALGALLMATLGAAVGLAALRGVHASVLMVPLAAEFLLVSPPPLAGWSMAADAGIAYALTVGAIVLLSGVWTSTLFGVLGRRLPRPPLEPLPREQALTYAVALTVAAAATTYVVLQWYPDGLGAWLIMTVLLLLQPDPHKALRKTVQRVAGTILGVSAAAILLVITDSAALHHALGSLLLVFAMSMHTKPYWRFVSVLTPAIVLMASTGADGVAVDAWRLGWTLAGAALAVVVTLVVNGVLVGRGRRRSPRPA